MLLQKVLTTFKYSIKCDSHEVEERCLTDYQRLPGFKKELQTAIL